MIIAIDPDVEKSGVAITEKGQILDLCTKSFVELVKFIAVVQKREASLIVIIEDVEANKSVFSKKYKVGPKAKLKIAQDIGRVKATARHLKAFLEDMGVNVVMIKPLKGTVKAAKTNAALFNRLTGWKGSSNEDKRDAGLLALFGGIKDAS
ncbi:hypothetical protein [Shewanella sp. T24-MNA-CIBAN-0130]|uniref:hypothetical protein n=1 Tax=Shewanella sp. T24-MNA-CIBAN-0130 TaxID=3140470 RepID=UPI00331DEED1